MAEDVPVLKCLISGPVEMMSSTGTWPRRGPCRGAWTPPETTLEALSEFFRADGDWDVHKPATHQGHSRLPPSTAHPSPAAHAGRPQRPWPWTGRSFAVKCVGAPGWSCLSPLCHCPTGGMNTLPQKPLPPGRPLAVHPAYCGSGAISRTAEKLPEAVTCVPICISSHDHQQHSTGPCSPTNARPLSGTVWGTAPPTEQTWAS